MPPQFPWPGRKPSSERAGADPDPQSDSVALEIADTPGSGIEGGSIRAHFSPFAPNVSGAVGITRRGSGGISTRLSGTPFPLTPPSSARGEQTGVPKRNTRRQKREQERRAAPEKVLTLFAMRLAVLEKIASNVGTLSFIWATVVLLGGFAITLKEIDFWFVTVILVIEGARIFSRSHELEWQHQDAGTAAENLFVRAYQRSSDVFLRSTRKIVSTLTMGRDGVDQKLQALESPLPGQQNRNAQPGDHHLTRTWSVSRVPILPVLDWIFRAKHISRLLYWMQLISACVATALAIYRLCAPRDFPRENETDTVRNHTAALLIFYSMAAFEALVFLLERSYWQFQISVMKILVRVNDMCGLTSQDLGTTRRFFYDVYSKCLNESIFEGLKMDMVDYALTWLQSDIPGEQLGGLRVLRTFTSKEESAEETLRSIGVKQGAVERLLEMVTWKNPIEHEIRKAAADLLSKLVKYCSQYCSRVAAISGSIEGIFTLLARDADDDSTAEYTRQGAAEPLAPKHIETHIVGLRILKNLAKDPLICAKIGLTRGLLARLVSFIDTNPTMLRNAEEPEHRIILVKKSLELLNLLASASGSSGKMLREEIGRIVYTISNLRIILEYGQAHMMLQDVATEILCSMAMDDDVREMTGRTGGVMRTLLALLMKERVDGDNRQMGLMQKAGEALALLALESRENCLRILRLKVRQGGVVVDAEEEEEREAGGEEKDVVAALLEMVGDWEVGDLAMSILRSLCAYSKHSECKERIGRGAVRKLMKLAVERGGRTQEAAVGLLAVVVGEVSEAELGRMMEEEGVNAEGLGGKLARLLERHTRPMTALPRLRRYAVELVLALAEHHSATFLPVFHTLRFRSLLHRLADSVSELENYATFSGATGVTPHSVPMSCLVDVAIERFRHQQPRSYPPS